MRGSANHAERWVCLVLHHHLNTSGARHCSDFFVESNKSRAFAESGGNGYKTTSELSQKTDFILGKRKELPEPVLTAYLPNDHRGAQTCPKGRCISW